MAKRERVESHPEAQEFYKKDKRLQNLIANRAAKQEKRGYWKGKKKDTQEELADLMRMAKALEVEIPRIIARLNESTEGLNDARCAVTTRKKILYDIFCKKKQAKLRKDLGLPTLKAHKT